MPYIDYLVLITVLIEGRISSVSYRAVIPYLPSTVLGNVFNDDSDSLSPANARCPYPILQSFATKLVGEVRHYTTPRRSEWVAQRDGAAVGVSLATLQPQLPLYGQVLNGKCFVDLCWSMKNTWKRRGTAEINTLLLEFGSHRRVGCHSRVCGTQTFVRAAFTNTPLKIRHELTWNE